MNEISGNTVTNIIKAVPRRPASNQRQSKYRLPWINDAILDDKGDKSV
ncbi:MAG TPA: hypothetical protein VFT15_05535 [Chitinophagaceae bacterium]|nr:hypothetical protein [Chitinophagaceae bacterium]